MFMALYENNGKPAKMIIAALDAEQALCKAKELFTMRYPGCLFEARQIVPLANYFAGK